jgi:hypothetical protein
VDTLVQNKYLVDFVTTLFAVLLTYALGGEEETSTRAGLVTVVVMNFNISLLFIQYFGDLERIKFVWIVVWVIFLVALIAAHALGSGGFDVSTGTAAEAVRKIGSPLISGVLVFVLYLVVDVFFDLVRPLVSML